METPGTVRRQFREEKQRQEAEAEARCQAKVNAQKVEEEAKQKSKETKENAEKAEKSLQEKRWSSLNATTEAEKQRTCLHSGFWPKEQQKRKFKCGSCGKKGGMMAYKCPHCSLLSCQLCLNKFNFKRPEK